jgi:hypothetical protein
MKNVNIATIKTNPEDLFEYWVALTQPLHKLTDTEALIFLQFLRKRHQYMIHIKDEELVDKFLMSTETRREIMKELGFKMGSFQNYLSSMRSKGVIDENRINRKLIPNYEDGSNNFRLIFNFIIDGQGNK